jgi:selenocysteine-specific elongation factor
MLTFGTAGHIDHGKSALIKALTSIDPDRLPEEINRGMTIDLGFAWMPLDFGETAGFIDVPGHKHFVHNVIPGLYGIDAALLVVAADDGWMPQTEEHTQILDLLGVNHSLVALTKIDLTDDAEWLELVEKDINERLAHTSLAGAPIVRVSSKTGAGLPELRQAVARLAAGIVPRNDIDKPRLPIDRVFTMKGSGVVVTGTLSHGHLSTGDDVSISPSGLSAHIRTIQSYKQLVDSAQPGSRVALNLTGIKKDSLSRGDIVLSDTAKTTRIVDVEVRLLPQLGVPLKSNSELMVYLGTRELIARVTLLEKKATQSPKPVLAQIRFEQEVATFIGEHFVLRRQSPAETVGGGIILDPFATKHRQKDLDKAIPFLNDRRNLELEQLILSELEKNKYLERAGFLKESLHSSTEIARYVVRLKEIKKLVATDSYLVDLGHWQKQTEDFLNLLQEEHQANPLKKGLSQAVLQSYLDFPREAFNQTVADLIDVKKIVRHEDTISLASHQPNLSTQQKAIVRSITALFKDNLSNPPVFKEIATHIPDSENVVRFMCQQGMLVELPDGILLEERHYQRVRNEIIRFLKEKDQISIQDVHSLFGFSRKYSIPLLSHLDREGTTKRQGDVRVLVKAA